MSEQRESSPRIADEDVNVDEVSRSLADLIATGVSTREVFVLIYIRSRSSKSCRRD